MSKRVVILGHFGGGKDFFDGQTVKTKILFDELDNKTDWEIRKIDTYWKKKHPIRLIMKFLWALVRRDDMIVLLSCNGMKTFFPIMYYFAKIWKVRIFHDVIGGNLDKHVMNNKRFVKYLNVFEVNWVETDILKKKLEEYNINNCEVIPNFKRLKIIEEKDFRHENVEPYRFCTFSRVMKEKGIEDSITTIEKINEEYMRNVCCLDIYGVIDDDYLDDFNRIIKNSSSAIKYCGIVPYDKSVDVLKEYYALLFPTFWKGEGFPGTIIDAFSSGIPVIASDWNSNKEIICHGKNGYLYPYDSIHTLKDGIISMIDNTDNYEKMKKQCIIDAKRYQPDIYINKIIMEIER